MDTLFISLLLFTVGVAVVIALIFPGSRSRVPELSPRPRQSQGRVGTSESSDDSPGERPELELKLLAEQCLVLGLRKELREARSLIKDLRADHHLLNDLDRAWRHGEIIQIRPRNDGLVSFEVSAPGRYYQTAAFSVREAMRSAKTRER